MNFRPFTDQWLDLRHVNETTPNPQLYSEYRFLLHEGMFAETRAFLRALIARDAVASLYPTAEEARITCAIVDAAAKVRDLNFKYLAEGKGATVTARFGPDGITICDPNRAGEGADKVFQRIYEKAI